MERSRSKDFLTQLGGYMVHRNGHNEGLTMAGLLMFGKGLPIRERFDNIRMDYIDKSHLIGDQRYSDRLTYDGMWENNLFNFLRIVVPRLTRDLPRPFNMKGVIRNDDTPQHKAVREAVTNMIIHADMMTNGLLRVEKYDDRLVLTNPGLLRLPLSQIYAGGESRARNQRIQNILRMIGYGENLGSGFPLILSAWNEKHWLRPQLTEQSELMQVKLVLHIDTAQDEEKNDKTQRLSARQIRILQLIDTSPTISDKEMSETLSVSTRTIERDIALLKGAGIIERKKNDQGECVWIQQLSNKDESKNDNIKELPLRQQAILRLIKTSPTITTKEMSETLSVSTRTIDRDIAFLKGASIIWHSGKDNDGAWVIKKNK